MKKRILLKRCFLGISHCKLIDKKLKIRYFKGIEEVKSVYWGRLNYHSQKPLV